MIAAPMRRQDSASKIGRSCVGIPWNPRLVQHSATSFHSDGPLYFPLGQPLCIWSEGGVALRYGLPERKERSRWIAEKRTIPAEILHATSILPPHCTSGGQSVEDHALDDGPGTSTGIWQVARSDGCGSDAWALLQYRIGGGSTRFVP